MKRRCFLQAGVAAIATTALGSQTKVQLRSNNLIYTGFPTIDKFIGGLKPGTIISFTSKNFIGDALALQKSVAENVAKDNKTVYLSKDKLDLINVDVMPIDYNPVDYDFVNEIIDLPTKESMRHLNNRSINTLKNKNIYTFVSIRNVLYHSYCSSIIFNIDNHIITLEKNLYGSLNLEVKVQYDFLNCTYSEVKFPS